MQSRHAVANPILTLQLSLPVIQAARHKRIAVNLAGIMLIKSSNRADGLPNHSY